MATPKGYSKGLTVEGLVVQALPGALTLRCYIFMSKRLVTCTCGSNSAVAGNGTKDINVPVEGTLVTINIPSLSHTSGGVITSVKGRIKTGFTGKERKIAEVRANAPAQDVTQLKDVDYYKEAIKDKRIVWAGGGNNTSVLPGDWMKGTPYGVLFYLSKFWCTMKATERASLEMFMFNDTVRLRSGYYQHFSAQGEEFIYNDEGYISRERSWALKNHDLYGNDKDVKMFEDTEEWGDKNNGVTAKSSGENRVHTVKEYEGSLASLYQKYTVNVADDKQISFEGQHVKGAKTFITNKTTKSILSPGMIPETPIRYKTPDDPSGDKDIESILEASEADKEFKYEDKYHNTHLQELDARIFEIKQLMHKFDKLKKDFKTDETINKVEIGAGYCVNEDGSVSWWDKAGSNIYMDGNGNIILAPKKNLVFQPGESLVGIVPKEFTIRAKENIDLIADEKDVRIRAKKNLQMLSAEGALLLESQAEGDPRLSGKGVNASGKGIIIKARESGILFDGKKIWATCDDFINHAKKKMVNASKAVYNVGDRVYSIAKDAALSLSSGSATLTGKNANVLGSSANLISGSNAAMINIPIGTSPYGNANSSMNSARDGKIEQAEQVDKKGDDAHFSFNNENHPVKELNQTMAQMIDINLDINDLSDDWDFDEPKETEHNTIPWPSFSQDFEYITYSMLNNANEKRSSATGEAGMSMPEKEYKISSGGAPMPKQEEEYESSVTPFDLSEAIDNVLI